MLSDLKSKTKKVKHFKAARHIDFKIKQNI